jgi:hypothetical protein
MRIGDFRKLTQPKVASITRHQLAGHAANRRQLVGRTLVGQLFWKMFAS